MEVDNDSLNTFDIVLSNTLDVYGLLVLLLPDLLSATNQPPM